jgi:S-adenosylmethionine/arginine decarboxylase-like enzyme
MTSNRLIKALTAACGKKASERDNFASQPPDRSSWWFSFALVFITLGLIIGCSGPSQQVLSAQALSQMDPPDSNKELQQQYMKTWGKSALIDIHNCSQKINSVGEIYDFIVKLCHLIGMERYGAPQIDQFGEGHLHGFSFMQFIKTSSITGHFDPVDKRAFIDIFSCKDFNEVEAGMFCQEFFGGKIFKVNVINRK